MTINTEHDLKTWPEPFEAVRSGDKKHEIRKADRDFAVGDLLVLHEWKPTHYACSTCKETLPFAQMISAKDWWPGGLYGPPVHSCAAAHDLKTVELLGEYTGRVERALVTYRTPGGEWGLPKSLCVLSIDVVRIP